jgi:BRCA1-associated protein
MESINMASPETHTGARARGKSVSFSNTGIGVGSGGLATKGRFVPTDSRNTELGWGIVHLYRDAEETPGLYDMMEGKPSGGGSSKPDEDAPTTDNNKGAIPGDCTTLCILAVPSYLTPSDFLGFVGEKTRNQVSHFRMIRTGRINRYMVLMKFREPAMAKEWRSEWNGKAFNSMEVRRTTDAGTHSIVAKSDFP